LYKKTKKAAKRRIMEQSFVEFTYEHSALIMIILFWICFVIHFIRLLKNEFIQRQQQKIISLEKEVNVNYIDITEMCKLIEKYTVECKELNQKISELTDECTGLNQKVRELTNELNNIQKPRVERRFSFDEATNRLPPSQTGVGVFGTALASSPKRKKVF
jgi:peptidoglycan hydrolase CwlO-like protein